MNGQKEMGKGNGQKKSFWSVLKESIAKSNDGCGPGCGCHAADETKKNGGTVAGRGKKK